MQGKEKHELEGKKSITIKMSAELRNLLDTKRELTGETTAKILERAVANLVSSNQKRPVTNIIIIAGDIKRFTIYVISWLFQRILK